MEVHSNGRVAKITLSDFGFRGHLPAAIGQLTQLIELYLGSHNDANLLEYDPSIAPDKSLSERKRTRMERNKEFLRLIHTPTQTSEPIARCAQGAQPDHSGHLALRGELYRGRDHRPQNRTSEAYPPL